jgi:predicted ATPase/transcriptional regulator with XRE-family HTH domain
MEFHELSTRARHWHAGCCAAKSMKLQRMRIRCADSRARISRWRGSVYDTISGTKSDPIRLEKGMGEQLSFGAWLRQRRKALDLTQEELAAQVGCSTVTIRRIEADARRPSKQLAGRLAACLDLAITARDTFVRAARGQIAPDRLAPSAQPYRPPIISLDLPRSNLPAQLSPLIGRGAEVQHICTLLRHPEVRLVTLTGIGGVGKTRLALKVAQELLDDYVGGVFVVDLAPISDLTLVASTVAKVLGRSETSGQPPLEDLKSYLRPKSVLLLLDNFEHVIEVAPMLVELLAAAPALKMLVTSRCTLQLTGEYEFAVPPLTVPDLQAKLSLERLHEYESVALFSTSARAAKRDFELTRDTALSVAEICHRLEGLPLAIELAAASVTILSLQQISARLGNSLALLASSNRVVPLRHRTLDATLDWSYRLLSPQAGAALRRLAVFAGGWSLEAAEAICSDDDLLPEQVLAVLSELRNKSFISMRVERGEARYRMLEMVRQYAHKQLLDAGEVESAQQRQLLFFARIIERAKPQLVSGDQVLWFERLSADLDNLRAAMDRALAQAKANPSSDTIIRALLMPADLERFWSPRGYRAEGAERLRRALALASDGDPAVVLARARALNAASVMLAIQEQFDEAREMAEQALAIGEAHGDQLTLLVSWRNLGTIAVLQRDTRGGAVLLQHCLGVEYTTDVEAMHSRAWALVLLGSAAYLEEDDARASSFYEESAVLLRTLGDANFLAVSLRRLGQIALRHQQYDRARLLFHESLELNSRVGDPSGSAGCLIGLAAVLLAEHAASEAARMLGTAQAILDETATCLTIADQEMQTRLMKQVREQLDAHAFQTFLLEGRAKIRADLDLLRYRL